MRKVSGEKKTIENWNRSLEASKSGTHSKPNQATQMEMGWQLFKETSRECYRARSKIEFTKVNKQEDTPKSPGGVISKRKWSVSLALGTP